MVYQNFSTEFLYVERSNISFKPYFKCDVFLISCYEPDLTIPLAPNCSNALNGFTNARLTFNSGLDFNSEWNFLTILITYFKFCPHLEFLLDVYFSSSKIQEKFFLVCSFAFDLSKSFLVHCSNSEAIVSLKYKQHLRKLFLQTL